MAGKQQAKKLSPRETEVLACFATLQLKEIAIKLFISYETVRTHLKNCVIKLNAKNPRHAILLAAHEGLI